MLVQARTEQEMLARVRIVLQRCREAGITISLRKLVYGQSVPFAGYVISSDGIRPDPEKLRAITDFPVPTNPSEVRSFLGLANQLAFFVPDIARLSSSIRALLKKGVAYQWLPAQQIDFDAIKAILTSDLCVRPFDINLPTEVLTDASRLHGIGFAILQREHNGQPRLISCGSRGLTSAEKNYATVELELLAIWWACSKSLFYLQGIPSFSVFTDHKPLVGLMEKPLEEILNPRLQRFREKLMPFNLTISWAEGKSHMIADALSRAPVADSASICHVDIPFEDAGDNLPGIMVRAVSVPAMTSLREAAKLEPYSTWIRDFHTGENFKKSPLRSVASRITLVDGLLVLDGLRLVVPPSERPAILALLHASHSGIQKTLANAKDLYFWPGLKRDVVAMVSSCETCQTLAPCQPREPLVFTLATGPMEQVGVDLFEAVGVHWLVVVDRFSGFPFLHRLRTLDTDAVTRQLDIWFTMFGFPVLLRSDGGPQFRTRFGEFCLERGIEWELSSPYNSQSNGLAESAVKAMKRLVIAVEPSNLPSAIQEWRNTPRSSDGISPSMAFFGRRTRGLLPCLPQPTLDFPSRSPLVDQSGQDLFPLAVDAPVWIQLRPGGTWKKGTVRAQKSGRTYLVELPNRKSYVRNRRFLRPLKAGPPSLSDASEPEAVVAPDISDLPNASVFEPEAVVAPEIADIPDAPEQPEAVVAPDILRRSRRTAGLAPEQSTLFGSRI